MIEGGDFNAWFKCRSNEGIAASKAGTQYTELLISLLLQPVDTASNIYKPPVDTPQLCATDI